MIENGIDSVGSEYFLSTKRLVFRCWTEQDVELAMGLWGDPNVTKYIVAQGRLTKDQIREKLFLEITTAKEYGLQYWPIFLRQSSKHVGCCGLRPYDVPRNICEFGVHIRSIFWRRGLATEAGWAVIDYAFSTVGVRGLFAGHNPKNETSRNLLQKLGFRYTHDEYYPPTGLHHPSYLLTVEGYNEKRET